jgi:D-sedoheptulose 7-phosphate isomerase
MSAPELGGLAADVRHDVRAYLDRLKAVIDRLDLRQVQDVVERLVDAHARGGFVYVFGNGGSAATASHFVNDFNKGASAGLSRKFRLCCLNDNVPTLLAIANDVGYDDVFRAQLENYLERGDLVVAISGSGNSPNVLKAVDYARRRGAETIGLVGYDGGRLKGLVDHCIHVPADDMQLVEDLHLVMNHVMMTALRSHLAARYG